MTLVSIAIAWIVVGFAAAIVFGFAISRGNIGNHGELPSPRGAEIKYMRRVKRGHASGLDLRKKQTTRRHATG